VSVKKAPTPFVRCRYALVTLWTVIVFGQLFFVIYQIKAKTKELIFAETYTNYKKDWGFRSWAALHGGVYVPVTPKTPPNPYLSNIPERDIETPSGKKLTLMNPAYMLRDLQEHFSILYGIKGRATSLKPLRPENKPDEWERRALESFERGVEVVSEFTEIDGKPYFRLIHPVFVEKDCLKCHGQQGYKIGDIRGGLDISLPISAYLKIENKDIVIHFASYCFIWMFGLLGITISMLHISREMMKRRLITEELRRSNEELQQFAFIASHDLQEPLRMVGSFSTLLAKRYEGKLDSTADEFISYMLDGVVSMQNLINDLLSYSQITTKGKDFEFVSCDTVLEETIGNIKVAIEESKAIVTYEKLPNVFGDSTQLCQLFQNLIVNAIKFCDKQPEIKIETKLEGTKWVFSVKDNGIGIEGKFSEKIFTVFHRLHKKTEYRGTGIGLSICKRIVERHGGNIWLKSEIDKGTSFYFTIPALSKKEMKEISVSNSRALS